MSLFRRREREREAREAMGLGREYEAPCPRCSVNLLDTAELVVPEDDCWRYTCGLCDHVSRWRFDDVVPMLVRDP